MIFVSDSVLKMITLSAGHIVSDSQFKSAYKPCQKCQNQITAKILLIRYVDTCIYQCYMYHHIIITTLSLVPFIISMCMFIHIFSASVYTTMYSLCFFGCQWQLFLCFVECNSREKGVVRPPISRHAPLVRGKPSQRGRGWQI